jgi:class 3 adenylate cyclase
LIGGRQFIFRQPEEISPEHQTTIAARTIQEIENVPCWLLVADIVDFTAPSRSLVGERLAALVGGWFATCKKIIEEHEGTINKYLGDGILVASLGEESLMGIEVNFAFRLEKLAALFGEACGLGDIASKRLEGLISSRRLGDCELKSFARKRAFFAL